MEGMIILTKEETSKEVKKLEKKVLKLFNEFGITPQGGAGTEISFIVNIPDEDDYERIMSNIREMADEAGFEIEVIED